MAKPSVSDPELYRRVTRADLPETLDLFRPGSPIEDRWWERVERRTARCSHCHEAAPVSDAICEGWRWTREQDPAERPDQRLVCIECVEDHAAPDLPPLTVCRRCARFLPQDAFPCPTSPICSTCAPPITPPAKSRPTPPAPTVTCEICGRQRTIRRAIERAWRWKNPDADRATPQDLGPVCWQCAQNAPDRPRFRICFGCDTAGTDGAFDFDFGTFTRNLYCHGCTNHGGY